MQKVFLIISFVIFLIPSIMLSQGRINQHKGDQLEIKLVTIDPGDELTMWWGHTAIIVEDKRTSDSRFYNYGLFSFEQENFIMNFLKGRLIFWVGDWNTSAALAYYQNLNREIRIQILNLSSEARLKIAERLAWNILPENREYLYDHYYDNCSTRVRDLINENIDGQLEYFTNKYTTTTLRKLTQKYTDRNYFIDWILMFLMSDRIDRPIKQWDEMFLPIELEKYVGQLMYKKEGILQPLVSKSYTHYKAYARKPIPEDAPFHWPYGLFVSLIIALIPILLHIRRSKEIWLYHTLFALYHVFIGIIFGIPGLVLFILSLFTDHTVTYNNENLFLANPLTFLLIPLGMFLKYKPIPAGKILPSLTYLLACLCLALLVLKIHPVFEQSNWLSISVITPIMISLALSWYLKRSQNE